MPTIPISLQPKQAALLDLIENHPAPVIGVGGGRGAAKSSGADRCAIILMLQRKLLCCMMMRNFDQIYKYHVEPIGRDFEFLDKGLKRSPPVKLDMEKVNLGKSELDFSYAENYDDIERRFRSANYDIIFIDQAEQFTAREIREVRKANRSKGGRMAKLVLLFNMRGSGIQDLRKWFHTHEVNKDENPADYVFLKFNPWDNVEWVRTALAEDDYTVADYYRWTDEQRKEYAATRGPYTKQLATDDEVIRQADWEGGWDSIEGAYFAHSFDLESTRVMPSAVELMRKNWATHWMAQDWGKDHWCAHFWAFRIALKPSEALEYLGWQLEKPINVTCVYREMIVNAKEAPEVAQDVIDSTPQAERERIKAYFLSPEEVTDEPNSIGSQQGRRLRPAGLPGAIKADNDRKGGYGLMGAMLKAAKGKGWGVSEEGVRFQYDDALLISSECAELLKAIPMLMRDPKNIDDVLKTDKSTARIEQDCGDACRYLLKSMLSPKKKSEEDVYKENMDKAGIAERTMLAFRHSQKTKQRRQVLPPSWKANR